MPKSTKKRKLPITSSSSHPLPPASSFSPFPRSRSHLQPTPSIGTSHRSTQYTISQFHTLLKRHAALSRQLSLSQATSSTSISESTAKDHALIQSQLDSIQAEMDSLGGMQAYQASSILGQGKERGGDSSRVLVEWLKEMGEDGLRSDQWGKERKIRLLEIGCLSPFNSITSLPTIQPTRIDLVSQHPSIQSQDFLQRPLPPPRNAVENGNGNGKGDDERFDLISCSLVLNFVGEAEDRGKMLALIHEFLLPSPYSSYLFLVLPQPCLSNSRYLTPEYFTRMMSHIGFDLVKERKKAGGKVEYGLWRWKESEVGTVKGKGRGKGKSGEEFGKKKVINEGKKRNNFCILLKEQGDGGV